MTSDLVPSDFRTSAIDVLNDHKIELQSPTARMYLAVCDRYQLDPLLKHVDIITTRNGPQLYVTRDGMLDIAHRSGQLDGIVTDELRRSSQNDGWTAYVSVWRKDMSHPFKYGAQCKDSEPISKQGNGPEMALARAERRALRRAFRIPTVDDGWVEPSDVVQNDGGTNGPAAIAGEGWPPVPDDVPDIASYEPDDPERPFD